MTLNMFYLQVFLLLNPTNKLTECISPRFITNVQFVLFGVKAK